MFVRAVGVLLSFASIAAGPADRNGPAEAQPSVALTAHDTIPPGRSCSSLADVSWSDGSKVTSAAEVPPEGVVPEYCEVTVLVPADIHIVVELPMTNWNGRYEALGGGGYDGSTLGLAFAPSALAQGYVTSATDTGHEGSLQSGEWAWTPSGMKYDLIEDFAYRANHEMAVKSKALIRSFYGTGPAYSYWNGCSSGGREGITEAVRYPDDFDGVLAESPAVNWTRLIPSEEWPALVMTWMDDYLPACKEALVSHVVLTDCNGSADGADDGLMDPRVCKFDPRKLIGTKTPCGTFTARDAAVIEEIWRGPRDQKGHFLWYGVEPGADLGEGVTLANTAQKQNGVGLTAVPFSISDDWLRYWIHRDPSWSYRTETYEQYVKDFDTSVRTWGSDLSTDDPDLTAFERHGGKLIIWHGLADQLISPEGTIDYYDRVLGAMGGVTRVATFARLFLSPNSPHCSTGTTGPYPKDPIAALVEWREHGVAPSTLAGEGTNPDGQTLTRNICPYPQRMAYNGSGNVLLADSFHCTGPPLPEDTPG